MSKTTFTNFPSQLKSFKQRTEKWYKKCIDAAADLIESDYHGIRSTYQNKVRNYNLANDVFDFDGLRKQLVPLYSKDSKYPIELQHYPIAIQKVDLLVGEEMSRPFNFSARITNDDAISEKEEQMNNEINEFFLSHIKNITETDEEFEKALKDKIEYINTSYQDKREILANNLLTYYWRFHNMSDMFSRGYYDLLISGEEIYRIDILGNEPIVRKADPLSITAIGGGNSPWVEDSELIIEDEYWSYSTIVDTYYNELTEAQVKKLEKGLVGSVDGTSGMAIETTPTYIMMDATVDSIAYKSNSHIYQKVNDKGEIRVTRAVWKSKRRVAVLTYFDELGELQQDIVHELYELDKSKGDVDLYYMWINEALEATRIGNKEDNIYIKMQPLSFQNRSIDNISKCSLGYVGVYANINTNRAMSLMDRLYPYQRAYNFFMNKLNFLYAKNKGPIYKLDFSTIPDGYEAEEWMYYADMLGWELSDPFNEGTKGASLGKLAGHLNQNQGVKEANMYNVIQQTMDMLNYIEAQAGSISGITKSREGQIHQRQAVSNVTREITASAHITEKWNNIHNQVKRRVLTLFLEAAKYSYKGKNTKKQYVLDDASIRILEIDGDMLNEASYDIQIDDSVNIQETFNALRELSHAALQTDKLKISEVMEIMTDNSIASIKRKIKQGETDKEEREDQAQQRAQEMQQEALEQEAILVEQEHELKLLIQAREIQKDLTIKLAEFASKETLSEREIESEEKLKKLELENRLEIERLRVKAIGDRNKIYRR